MLNFCDFIQVYVVSQITTLNGHVESINLSGSQLLTHCILVVANMKPQKVIPF